MITSSLATEGISKSIQKKIIQILSNLNRFQMTDLVQQKLVRSAKILERMVNLNTYDDIAQVKQVFLFIQ